MMEQHEAVSHALIELVDEVATLTAVIVAKVQDLEVRVIALEEDNVLGS